MGRKKIKLEELQQEANITKEADEKIDYSE